MTYRPRRSDLLEPTHHVWHRWRLSTQKFAVMLSVAAFLSGFGYVLLTNSTAAEGFAIKGLQQQVATLQTQNEKLQLQAADIQTLASVERSTASIGLAATDRFETLPATTGAVAVK